MYSLKKQTGKATFGIACAVMLSLFTGRGESLPPNLTRQIDWPAFIASHDLVWHHVPANWEGSPFLGNGWMGAMIYQEPKNTHALRIDVQHAGVNDHRADRTGGDGAYNQSRLPIGRFVVTAKGEILDCDWRLDLWNAELTGTVQTTTGKIFLRALIHTEDMVALVELRNQDGENAAVEFLPDKAISPRADPVWKRQLPSPYPLNPAPEIISRDGVKVCRQALLAGGDYATAWTLETNANLQTLRFSVAQNFPQSNSVPEAISNLHRASGVPLETWLTSHRTWWHNYYQRSFVSFDDTYWESFYWIQRYKMACATRADRALIDNQGPWLQRTPWPYATWNLNVQLTYWPFNAAGLLDLASSLPNHLRDHATALHNTVPPPYRVDSAAIGRCVTESLEGQIGVPGEKGAELGNLTWALHNVWLQYRHTMDDALLRDPLFPLLRRSINYYRHFLTNGVDGRLHLPSTVSPEYGEASDCNYDLSLLRWGCQTLLWANDRLKLNDPLAPEWQKILEQLTPYPGDERQGYYIGAGVPFTKGHRHYSHLLMIYPLYLVNVEQLGGREQIERSVAHWQSLPKGLLGFSMTGAASIYAALGDGNRALAKLNGLRRFILPATMYHESGPVIETPLSGAQAIHDMFLQSWGDTIRIFPALPSVWKNVTFDNLRTEGAFEVSAVSRNGQTQWVRVKSLAGEPFKIRPNLPGEVHISGSGAGRVKKLSDGLFALELSKGEEVLIAGKNSLFEIRPTQENKPFRFGLP